MNITMSNTITVEAETEEQAETIAWDKIRENPYRYASESEGAHCEESFVVETDEV